MAKQPDVAPGWEPDMKSLIHRFRELGPATHPFSLSQAEQVIDPAKYHRALEADIRMGPGGLAGRTGALRRELERYLSIRARPSPGSGKL